MRKKLETELSKMTMEKAWETMADIARAPHERFVVAAHFGDLKTVAELLSSGVKPDVKIKGGSTALYEACRWGHVEVVRIFYLARRLRCCARMCDRMVRE